MKILVIKNAEETTSITNIFGMLINKLMTSRISNGIKMLTIDKQLLKLHILEDAQRIQRKTR